MKRRGLCDLTNNNNHACNIRSHPAQDDIDYCTQAKWFVGGGKRREKCKIPKKETKTDVYFFNEYSNEIFMYLLSREADLFRNSNVIVKDSVGRISMIMWFITVANKIQISNDCVHLAIALFDRYQHLVSQIDYTYTGIIILWIASKIEDSAPISLKKIINQTHLACGTEIKTRCIKLEIEILRTLDFNVNIPTPIQFLRHFTRIAKTNEDCHQAAKFIIDLTSTDSRFVGLHYSIIAASGFCLAADLVKHVPEVGDSWSVALRRYTAIDKNNLFPIMKEMTNLLVNTNKILKQLLPLYRRYSKTVDSVHLSKESIRNYQYKMPIILNQ